MSDLVPISAAPLQEYFEAEPKGDGWDMYCRACGLGWHLEHNGGEPRPGNVLRLLDHARSHPAKKPAKGR